MPLFDHDLSEDHNTGRNPLQEWHESAPYWAKHAHTVRTLFEPITSALLGSPDINRAGRVLDVACGSGEPSISIAHKIGGSSLVVCTDAIAGMLAATRKEALRRKLEGIEFTQCLGGQLPFRTGQFDAVICRLGIMLFKDPQDSAKEMLRVLGSGRFATCVVWDARESNPFFQVVTDVLSYYVESPPEDPDAPGAFRYAESGKLSRLFLSCGAAAVSEQVLDFTIKAEMTPLQFWELRAELSDTLRTKVATLPAAKMTTLRAQVEEAARPFFSGGQMEFPARVRIVRAQKA